MGTRGRAQAKKCHTYFAHHSSRANIPKDGHVESKKTENISWGNVRHGVRSDGKPLGRRSCPTGNLSRWIPRVSSLSCGRLAGFRSTAVHSRRGNSTTTTPPQTSTDHRQRSTTVGIGQHRSLMAKVCVAMLTEDRTCKQQWRTVSGRTADWHDVTVCWPYCATYRHFTTCNYCTRLHITRWPAMCFVSYKIITCHRSHYTVWVKKKSPWGVLTFFIFFTNGWEFLIDFLHTYYTFLSTLDKKNFLFNYPRFWRSYAILSATTQFTQYAQNVHNRPKRMRWHVCVSRW